LAPWLSGFPAFRLSGFPAFRLSSFPALRLFRSPRPSLLEPRPLLIARQFEALFRIDVIPAGAPFRPPIGSRETSGAQGVARGERRVPQSSPIEPTQGDVRLRALKLFESRYKRLALFGPERRRRHAIDDHPEGVWRRHCV